MDNMERVYRENVARLKEIDDALAVVWAPGYVFHGDDVTRIPALEAERVPIQAEVDQILAQRPELAEG